ncbi:MAG: o-succinylbenzoate synthase [Crocinitomicaceae bacterium]
MLKASSEKITLEFKQPAGTSRGVLREKDSWIIRIWDEKSPQAVGKGEASIIKSLNPEWSDEYESFLKKTVSRINDYVEDLHQKLRDYPSIRFAVESALLDLKNNGNQLYFETTFTRGSRGIPINGLIWMGDKDFMLEQVREKLGQGFTCIKMKIGAIDFDEELRILDFIRSHHSKNEIELRVDANGAFHPDKALEKLKQLAKFDLHSIEQPIQQGQWNEMRQLCMNTPLPIALDEELIGITAINEKRNLLDKIQPQYIILKPSLVGGLRASDEWIELAEERKIGWWITSALESNVGLNVIAQYTATKNNPMPQGLGTGSLFSNNLPSALSIKGDHLFYHK